MTSQVDNLTNFGLNISTYIQPFIAMTIIAIMGLMFKDFINSVVKGLSFKLKSGFSVGEQCYIDEEKAVIIQIGIKQTIFEINNCRGKVWRYVPNERIPYLRLEKVIEDRKEVLKDMT